MNNPRNYCNIYVPYPHTFVLTGSENTASTSICFTNTLICQSGAYILVPPGNIRFLIYCCIVIIWVLPFSTMKWILSSIYFCKVSTSIYWFTTFLSIVFLYQTIALIFLHCTVIFFNIYIISYYITLCFYHLSDQFIRPAYQISLSGQFIRTVYQTSLSDHFIMWVCQTILSGQFIRPVYQTSLSGQFIRLVYVVILEEGNLPHPWCPLCDMLVPWKDLNGTHRRMEQC